MKYCWLVLLGLGALNAADAPPPAVVDQIVAKVNGDIVSQNELARSAKQITDELKAQGASGAQLQQAVNEREKDLLRDRIDQLLLVEKGKDLNINVDSEVSKYVASLQRQSRITDT